MSQKHKDDYSFLDQPHVLKYLFHPRLEDSHREMKKTRDDVVIPVGGGVKLGASFHFIKNDAPVILFFHGNGEIVSDYDDFGFLFNEKDINFFVVDYRGYGRSGGRPSVSSMMQDCQKIFDFVLAYMSDKNLIGSLNVMGRSLGSAPAIELCTRADEFDSLIIESGFAWISPLLQRLGVNPEILDFNGQKGFENIDKIKVFSKPCLVIHAQLDSVIPFSDGRALFDACPSTNKMLLEVKGASHNDIFLRGMGPYLEHVKKICG